MSVKQLASPDLTLRLELLRLRVAVERQSLAVHSQQLRVQLSPQHWLESASELQGGQLLAKGFSLAVQHPYLTSALTAVLVRRRWRILKWSGLALAAWQTIQITKSHKL